MVKQLQPIAQGDNYQVYVPSVDFFVNKVLNKDYFSFTKLSLEWWMLLKKAIILANLREECKSRIDPKYSNILAREMFNEWNERQKMNRKYKTDVNVIERILKMSLEPKPNNFYVGVTDRCNIDHLTFPMPARGKDTSVIIRKTMPKDEIPYHALVLRVWAVTGEILNLVERIQHKKIVVVGPSHLRNFGDKLNLPKFSYYPIHDTDAIMHVHKTKKEIQELHKKLLKQYEDVTYFFIGGGAAMWLITELHRTMPKANLIDVGRAFDVFYFYDLAKKKYPEWMFGSWLNGADISWVKEKFARDQYGTFKKK